MEHGGVNIKTFTIVLLAVFAFAVNRQANACDFDVDCEVGSRCRGGVCVGGLWPGNDNDDSPMRRRDRPTWDLNETYGDTCNFDVDCGPGMRCAKGGGIDGVCVRRR